MSRMHSGAKGKSGSTKPSKTLTYTWVRYKPKEVELLVAKLFKEGKSASQIGIFLRDTYGIPSVNVLTKKSITEILKEKKLASALPEDITSLIRKVINLRKHTERNRHDEPARRGITLAESKIKRLIKYYKRTGILPADWKYDFEKVKLIVE